MPKIEKKLQKWRNSRQDVPKEELISVLNYYFPDMWTYGGKTGSHIYKISHPKLKGLLEYGLDGEFVIPVSGGQRVKHFYLKKLIKTIELVEEQKS